MAYIADGAGLWQLFLEIAVPFGASGMMVVAILTFFNPLLFSKELVYAVKQI